MLYFSISNFVDAIVLLLNKNTAKVKKLIKEFLDLFDEESKRTGTLGKETMLFYAQLLRKILEHNITIENTSEFIALLLKLESSEEMNIDKDVLKKIEKLLQAENKPSEDNLKAYMKNIKRCLDWYHCKYNLSKAFAMLNDCSLYTSEEKQEEYLNKSYTVLKNAIAQKDILDTYNDENLLSLEKIDLSDKESIRKGIESFKKRKIEGVFKTGWQGLNKMFGSRGGPTRGESICFCGLMHQFKSGILKKFAKWFATCVTPTKNNERTPTILFISLENEASENLMDWYEEAYFHIFNVKPVGLQDDEIIDTIYNFYNKRGFKLIVERRLGYEFGFDEFKELIESYEACGCEIYGVIIDYVNQMKRHTFNGEKGVRDDLGIKNIFTALCNYCKNKAITLVTAHQLNRKAAELVSSGVRNVVKHFNENHLAGSMDVLREVDFAAYIHIERNQFQIPYFTMMRAKHRYVNNTPKRDWYCAYKFTKLGIPDDLTGKAAFVKNIYTDEYDASCVDDDISDIIKDNTDSTSEKVELFD